MKIIIAWRRRRESVLIPPQGNYVMITGARIDQMGREILVNGIHRGAFTYSLIHQLERSPLRHQLSRFDPAGSAVHVKNLVNEQSPQLSTSRSNSIFSGFLGQNVPQVTTPYHIEYAPKEKTLAPQCWWHRRYRSFQRFAKNASFQLNSGETIEVVTVFPTYAVVSGVPPDLDEKTFYPVTCIRMPAGPTTFYIDERSEKRSGRQRPAGLLPKSTKISLAEMDRQRQ